LSNNILQNHKFSEWLQPQVLIITSFVRKAEIHGQLLSSKRRLRPTDQQPSPNVCIAKFCWWGYYETSNSKPM